MSAPGYEPSRNRSRLAAAAAKADMLHAECRRLNVADAAGLHALCRAAGVNDPRDVAAQVQDAIDVAVASC